MDYSKEKRLFILLNRVTFSLEDELEVKKLLDFNISWCELLKYAMYNKTTALVWYNLKRFKAKHIPKYIKTILEFTYIGHKKQNEIYLQEIEKIKGELNQKGIWVAPVKGAMLLRDVYKDIGIRALGDVDFLIKKADQKELDKVIRKIGYIKGTYDSENKCVKPVDREEDIAWKLGSTNIFPYMKVVESDYMPFIKIDFRYALEYSLNDEPINEIMDYVINTGEMNCIHVLAHLLVHLFHESFTSRSVLYNKDINMIKFCDIREYFIKHRDEINIEEFVCFVKKYNLEQAIYYGVYYLKMIYDDGYEDEILDKLLLDDLSFLNQYENHLNKEICEWKSGFFERMFSSDNMSELKEIVYENNKTF